MWYISQKFFADVLSLADLKYGPALVAHTFVDVLSLDSETTPSVNLNTPQRIGREEDYLDRALKRSISTAVHKEIEHENHSAPLAQLDRVGDF